MAKQPDQPVGFLTQDRVDQNTPKKPIQKQVNDKTLSKAQPKTKTLKPVANKAIGLDDDLLLVHHLSDPDGLLPIGASPMLDFNDDILDGEGLDENGLIGVPSNTQPQANLAAHRARLLAEHQSNLSDKTTINKGLTSMEKTLLRFISVEMIERIARCDALLTQLEKTSQRGNRNILGVVQGLQNRLALLQQNIFQEKDLILGLLSDTTAAQPHSLQSLLSSFQLTYQALGQLTHVLTRVEPGEIQPETYLFLKDALPDDLAKQTGQYTVVIDAEGKRGRDEAVDCLHLEDLQISWLSVIQQQNPLAWVSLPSPVFASLAKTQSAWKPLFDRVNTEIGAGSNQKILEALAQHSLGIRLLGPAYYFDWLSHTLLSENTSTLLAIEPLLFYGLNHFNVAHEQTVILHEAIERMGKEQGIKPTGYSQALLADWYRLVERTLPERLAYSRKHLDRSTLLKERLAEGVLLSSSAVFPMSEVAKASEAAQQQQEKEASAYPIYDILSMTTEYPNTPREIVNAGWLHKMERGTVWLFASLQETLETGSFQPEAKIRAPYQKLSALLGIQDHLLRKSIETAEVHRVLLCSPTRA